MQMSVLVGLNNAALFHFSNNSEKEKTMALAKCFNLTTIMEFLTRITVIVSEDGSYILQKMEGMWVICNVFE